MSAGDDDSTPAQLGTPSASQVSDKKLQVNVSYHKIGCFEKLSQADFDKLGEAGKEGIQQYMIVSFPVIESSDQNTQEGENPSKKRKVGAHFSTGAAYLPTKI